MPTQLFIHYMVTITTAAPPMVLSDDPQEDPSNAIVECVPVSPMQQDQKKSILAQGVTSGE